MRPRLVAGPAFRKAALLAFLPCTLIVTACGQNSAINGITTSSLPAQPSPQAAPQQAQPNYAWKGNPTRTAYAPAPQPAAEKPPVVWHATPRPPQRPGYMGAQAYGLGSARTVDVREGDTLYSIARTYNVTVASLVDTNRLKSIAIYPGQRLVLPAGAR